MNIDKKAEKFVFQFEDKDGKSLMAANVPANAPGAQSADKKEAEKQPSKKEEGKPKDEMKEDGFGVKAAIALGGDNVPETSPNLSKM